MAKDKEDKNKQGSAKQNNKHNSNSQKEPNTNTSPSLGGSGIPKSPPKNMPQNGNNSPQKYDKLPDNNTPKMPQGNAAGKRDLIKQNSLPDGSASKSSGVGKSISSGSSKESPKNGQKAENKGKSQNNIPGVRGSEIKRRKSSSGTLGKKLNATKNALPSTAPIKNGKDGLDRLINTNRSRGTYEDVKDAGKKATGVIKLAIAKVIEIVITPFWLLVVKTIAFFFIGIFAYAMSSCENNTGVRAINNTMSQEDMREDQLKYLDAVEQFKEVSKEGFAKSIELARAELLHYLEEQNIERALAGEPQFDIEASMETFTATADSVYGNINWAELFTMMDLREDFDRDDVSVEDYKELFSVDRRITSVNGGTFRGEEPIIALNYLYRIHGEESIIPSGDENVPDKALLTVEVSKYTLGDLYDFFQVNAYEPNYYFRGDNNIDAHKDFMYTMRDMNMSGVDFGSEEETDWGDPNEELIILLPFSSPVPGISEGENEGLESWTSPNIDVDLSDIMSVAQAVCTAYCHTMDAQGNVSLIPEGADIYNNHTPYPAIEWGGRTAAPYVCAGDVYYRVCNVLPGHIYTLLGVNLVTEVGTTYVSCADWQDSFGVDVSASVKTMGDLEVGDVISVAVPGNAHTVIVVGKDESKVYIGNAGATDAIRRVAAQGYSSAHDYSLSFTQFCEWNSLVKSGKCASVRRLKGGLSINSNLPDININADDWYTDLARLPKGIKTDTVNVSSSSNVPVNIYKGLPWSLDNGYFFNIAKAQAETEAIFNAGGVYFNGKEQVLTSNIGDIPHQSTEHVIDGEVVWGVGTFPALVDKNYISSGRWRTDSAGAGDSSATTWKYKMALVMVQKGEDAGVSSNWFTIPLSKIDAKAHTFPFGIYQTNVKAMGAGQAQISTNWSGTNGHWENVPIPATGNPSEIVKHLNDYITGQTTIEGRTFNNEVGFNMGSWGMHRVETYYTSNSFIAMLNAKYDIIGYIMYQ